MQTIKQRQILQYPLLGIVTPTHNAWKELEGTLSELHSIVPSFLSIIIDDGSKDGTAEYAREVGSLVPHHFKKLGYGKSLIEGLAKASFECQCDYVISMDADHPVDPVESMLEGLATENFDIIVGVEEGNRTCRSVAGFLAKRFLALGDFTHPTCGYVAFTNNALKILFTKEKIKSNNDFVHVEILYKAKRCGLRFGEVTFDGSKHPKHRMSIMRVFRWLWSFSFLFYKRIHWHIWIDLLRNVVGKGEQLGGM